MLIKHHLKGLNDTIVRYFCVFYKYCKINLHLKSHYSFVLDKMPPIYSNRRWFSYVDCIYGLFEMHKHFLRYIYTIAGLGKVELSRRAVRAYVYIYIRQQYIWFCETIARSEMKLNAISTILAMRYYTTSVMQNWEMHQFPINLPYLKMQKKI